MGILPKLFENLSKDLIRPIKEYEEDLFKLQITINAKILAIIDIEDKFGGHFYITSSDDKKILEEIFTELSEKFPETEGGTFEDKFFNQIILNFKDFLFFFKPLSKKIGIVAIIHQADDIKIIKDWLKKRAILLEKVFGDKIIL